MAKLFEKESRDMTKNEFVEALVFSQTEAVVMTGKMTDEPGKTKANEITINSLLIITSLLDQCNRKILEALVLYARAKLSQIGSRRGMRSPSRLLSSTHA